MNQQFMWQNIQQMLAAQQKQQMMMQQFQEYNQFCQKNGLIISDKN